MQIGLEQADIVILGPGQNPSLVTEGWVEDHGVLPGRRKQSVCTDALSVHESEGFLLLVDQEHFQLTSALSTDEGLSQLAAAARRYVEAFPNVVFQSLGLSYAWKIEGKSGERVPEIEVRLGVVDPRHLLGQERTLCGGILIKTIDSSKLKVAIEPSPPSGLLMTFNYQTDVAARRDDLVTGIEHFVATKDESGVLTRRFCGIEE